MQDSTRPKGLIGFRVATKHRPGGAEKVLLSHSRMDNKGNLTCLQLRRGFSKKVRQQRTICEK